MNIRMLTPAERERLAYTEDHPDKELLELLAELEDTKKALETAQDDLFDAQAHISDLEDALRSEQELVKQLQDKLDDAEWRLEELQ